MAKVVCSVDTEKKEVKCTVDGEEVDNFGYMSVYGDKSMYGFMLSMASVEELDDLTKTTHWSHSNQQFIDDIDSFLLGRGTDDKDADDKPAKKGKKKMKEGEEDMDEDEMMMTKEKKKCK